MNYYELMQEAIRKNEVIKILKGEGKYEILVSEFTSDVFPTDINSVLVNFFYKQKQAINGIDLIFDNAYNQLLCGGASDVYIAVLYFDACIFQEELKKNTFIIDKNNISNKLRGKILLYENELKGNIQFSNGMIKKNPWNTIINFNKYYQMEYNISIV